MSANYYEKIFKSLPNKIAGSNILIMDELRKNNPELFPKSLSGQMDYSVFETQFRKQNPIQLRIDKRSISFTMQDGPVKEVGNNGCQVDALIEMALHILQYFDGKFSCKENAIALRSLENALAQLALRRKDREERGVEGFNKA